MTVLTNDGPVAVPAWVVDHASFLTWIRSGVVPEGPRVMYIRDQVVVDTMSERAFAHNRVKCEIGSVLKPLAQREKLGTFFGDGMLWTTNLNFSTIPDGMFVRRETVTSGRVELVGSDTGEHETELVGSPDLIIEVVSHHSADDDTEWLMSKYYDAGVEEYWLIDARRQPLRFTIYRRKANGFVPVRKAGGWVKSPVLGRSFQFVETEDAAFRRVDYRLEVR